MTAIIKLISRIVIGLLWFRFVVRLFAIPLSGISILSQLYGYTGYLVAPFQGVFPNVVLGGRFLIESTTLFAIVVYALIEFILIKLLRGSHHDDY